MGKKSNRCPLCKDGTLKREIKKLTYRYKDKSVEVDQPGEYCSVCGEGFLCTNDIKAIEKELKALIGK